ncbi:MAG TPA: glycosyltransferase [bacterium]|nr:glycosyltransferase [bacterium]
MAHQTRLDVLHVIGSLAAGGAERNLYYLAPAMAKSKLSYGICCLAERGQFADEVEQAGVPVHALGFRRRHALVSTVKLARLMRSHRVRVVHTHLYEPGVFGRIAAWLAGVPVIITHEHGKTTWKKWYHRWFERLAIKRTDLRIAVSGDIRDLRLRHEHTPPAKIVVIGNAVGPSRFEAAAGVRESKRAELGLGDAFVVGTVGRMVVAKSYDLLVRVAREVCRRRADMRFLLVGDGPLREELTRLRDSLGIADKVSFLGTRTDIPEFLAAIDLYVLTSQREGLPISLLEAMLAAKPIIATAVGGIPEAVNEGAEGLLVEPGNEAALTEAILALADDPIKRRAMGERARAKARGQYSPEAVLGAIEAIYFSIMQRKGIAANET